jgi:hypothetical protein
MSWKSKYSFRRNVPRLDWVAWGNKKAMYQIYEWKNYEISKQRDLVRAVRNPGWFSKFVNMVGL